MKSIFLPLAFLFVSICCGQDFPGPRADLLLNKTVTPIIKEKQLRQYGYKNFYANFNAHTKKLGKKHAFSNGLSTDYSKLAGRKFKISHVYTKSAQLTSNRKKYYILELKNDQLGTIYYNYDSQFRYGYELNVIGGLNLPEKFYCANYIKTTKDASANKIKFYSARTEGIQVIRIKKNGAPLIYLSIQHTQPKLKKGEEGIILFLKNHKKIKRPDLNIEMKKIGGTYLFSACIKLTSSEIKLLSNNALMSSNFFNYQIKYDYGNVISEYLKCLSSE